MILTSELELQLWLCQFDWNSDWNDESEWIVIANVNLIVMILTASEWDLWTWHSLNVNQCVRCRWWIRMWAWNIMWIAVLDSPPVALWCRTICPWGSLCKIGRRDRRWCRATPAAKGKKRLYEWWIIHLWDKWWMLIATDCNKACTHPHTHS